MEVGVPPTGLDLREPTRLPGPYVPEEQACGGKRVEPSSSPNKSEGGFGSPLPRGRCCSPGGVLVCMQSSLKM